jgi:chemotaxis signal transduction protein
MHVVLWTAAGHRYATRTEQVVEVIAPVEARPVPEGPTWLRGTINYRGQLIPLLDVPCLLGHHDWPLRMASRILVVTIDDTADRADRFAALLVQSVQGSEELDFARAAEMPYHSTPCGEFLGPIALRDGEPIQLTLPDRIVWEP